MIALYTLFYNFARIHKTLKMSPAMAAGITDTLWSIEDIAALCEAKAPVKRGAYKKRDVVWRRLLLSNSEITLSPRKYPTSRAY